MWRRFSCSAVHKIKRLRAKMRNVRQQCEILLAAFDQARYEFFHNANLRLTLFGA
jgi:hypothetical protein